MGKSKLGKFTSKSPNNPHKLTHIVDYERVKFNGEYVFYYIFIFLHLFNT